MHIIYVQFKKLFNWSQLFLFNQLNMVHAVEALGDLMALNTHTEQTGDPRQYVVVDISDTEIHLSPFVLSTDTVCTRAGL